MRPWLLLLRTLHCLGGLKLTHACFICETMPSTLPCCAGLWLLRSTLHGNNLTGGLPLGWAQPGSFTVLKMLTLSDNPRLGGTLPADWVSVQAAALCLPAAAAAGACAA